MLDTLWFSHQTQKCAINMSLRFKDVSLVAGRMECARTRTEGRSGGNCGATKREASIPSPVTMATYLHPHSATIPEHGDMKCAWCVRRERKRERERDTHTHICGAFLQFLITSHPKDTEQAPVFWSGFCSLHWHTHHHTHTHGHAHAHIHTHTYALNSHSKRALSMQPTIWQNLTGVGGPGTQ